ncbi:MAG: lytic transglycosylase domain-containing protein [Candidatus Sericytochromatia bacterium]|nr:lytic transglycosylase domain-containing protein [Candidatus Sericytochromatia bacterium]
MPALLPLLLAATVVLGLSGCLGRLARYGDERPRAADAVTFQPERGAISEGRLAAFILVTNPFLAPADARVQAEAIARHAHAHGLPVHLVASLIATESSFNPRAVSPVGAQGLGQLMPATAREMGVMDPFDPEQNIGGTTRYLAWLAKVWHDHPQRWELVLASYLAGIGTVTRQVRAGQPLTGEQGAYVDKILRLSGKV